MLLIFYIERTVVISTRQQYAIGFERIIKNVMEKEDCSYRLQLTPGTGSPMFEEIENTSILGEKRCAKQFDIALV